MPETLNSQIEAMPATIAQRVTEAIKGLFGTAEERFTTLKAQFDALSARATQLEADLATAKASLASVSAERDGLQAAAAAVVTERAALKTEREAVATEKAEQEKTFNARVAAGTRELAAAQGIKIEQLPSAPSGGAVSEEKARSIARETYQQLLAEGKSLEAGQFYQANKQHFLPLN